MTALKKHLSITFLFAAILLSYQNCSQPGDLTINDKATGTSGTQNGTNNNQGNNGQPQISEFQCKKIVSLNLNNQMSIPARDAEGTCYAVKLFDAISNSPSSLTQEKDTTVVARDHDQGGSTIDSPYVLGFENITLTLADRRFVKLSGSGTSLAPIKVDNFIIRGIYPASVGGSPSLNYFKAYGTADSRIPNSDSVQLNGQNLPLASFGAAGTSTVAALDITGDIQPNLPYRLELRALDCGGSRELSEVYLLFQ